MPLLPIVANAPSPSQEKSGCLRRIGRHGVVLSLVLLLSLTAHGARAESLVEALVRTYITNPALKAERAKLRAIDEQVPQALAGMRPSVNLTTQVDRVKAINRMSRESYGTNDKVMSVDVTQPIYRGGRIQANISSAENKVLAGRAALLSLEQSTLLSAATAYMDVLRDQLSLNLIMDYQRALENRFEIEKRRLLIGENTKTDVSQAQARVAQAIADRIQAEATLRSTQSDYLRIVGQEPGVLINPKITVDVPNDLDTAVTVARTDNPDVISAQYSERSARHDVEAIDGELLPAVDAVGTMSRTWNNSATAGMVDRASVMLRMTMPLDNGAVSARARGARQTVSQMMLQAENSERSAVDRATKSWNFLKAVQAQIQSRNMMITSINETLRSLRSEVSIGTRTVVDLLNTEQEALSSRLGLITAKHDEVVWSLTLMSAIGRLTAQKMKLPVEYYDYEKHYYDVRGKVWGVAISGDKK